MHRLPKFIRDNYEIHQWRHAVAILSQDFPDEFADICNVFRRFRLPKSSINIKGGRKSKVSEWIDTELSKLGWVQWGNEIIEHESKSVRANDPLQPTFAFDGLRGRP